MRMVGSRSYGYHWWQEPHAPAVLTWLTWSTFPPMNPALAIGHSVFHENRARGIERTIMVTTVTKVQSKG